MAVGSIVRALVIDKDGSSRPALTGCRALHRAGWEVGVGGPRTGLPAWSRTVSRRHLVPAPTDLPQFVAAVNEAIAAGGYEVVFGAWDAETLALSLTRADIRAVVPYPEHERVVRALDKRTLEEVGARAGFAVPRSVVADDDALAAWSGPAIVKASSPALPGRRDRSLQIFTRFASDAAAARPLVEDVRAKGGIPLLQEVVAGRLRAYVAVVDESASPVASSLQEAEEIWPPDAGVTVRGHTVPMDPEIDRMARALLRDLGWFGLAELQFLVAADGTPYVIDFNGRFYGSLALAVGAGVNLPHLWACLATGRPVQRGAQTRPGVGYQWLEGDMRRVLAERPERLVRELLGCLRHAPGRVHSIWDPRDPLPAARHGAWLTGRALRRLMP